MREIIYFALIALCSAQCPQPGILLPCRCEESRWTEIFCENTPPDFDLKEVFDRASEVIGDDVEFELLQITNTSLTEIPDNAVQHLKIRKIHIQRNANLVYISPRAFTASRSVTRNIEITRHEKLDGGNVFEFIRSFDNLWALQLERIGLTEIPSGGFGTQDSLYMVYIQHNNISHIGTGVFSRLPDLNLFDLRNNSIPSEGLSELTFAGISRKVVFTLRDNPTLEFLDRNVFKPLLDNAELVGVSSCYSDDANCADDGRLYCDERADWICDNWRLYENKLRSYYCKSGSPYNDIGSYCRGKVGRNELN